MSNLLIRSLLPETGSTASEMEVTNVRQIDADHVAVVCKRDGVNYEDSCVAEKQVMDTLVQVPAGKKVVASFGKLLDGSGAENVVVTTASVIAAE